MADGVNGNKIVFMMGISLDGYMERPGGDISWHHVDDELHQYMNDLVAQAGTHLVGRRTHELMADFWPTADQDPSNPPEMVEYAAIWRQKPKIVYSRTRDHIDWSTQVMRDVVPAEVEALRAESVGDLLIGGADLAATFRRLDLIDEYRVHVHPVLVGRGTPMFTPSDDIYELHLLDTHTFGNGVVMLHYERAR